MTEKLYLVDNYLKEFKAKVIEITAEGVVLDKTAFYPEGGGQVGDKGLLEFGSESITITNTRMKKAKIIHETSAKDLQSGVEVTGRLNWEYRYKLMRSHSAQHVISRWFQLNFKAETVSNKLKYDRSHLDLHPLAKITSDQLESITTKINEYLSQNLTISKTVRPRKEAIEYLKKKEYQIKYLEMVPKSVQNFRIVTIGDYDFAACAGTHVKNTSEIGSISLISTKNKGKLRERIYYKVNP